MRVKFLSLLIFTAVLCVSSFDAQTPREPNRQTLLNGLKVLIWSDANSPKITVKLRIHSGSAFDPRNKTGVMALLADILFPSEQTREFFREELEGNLEVVSNYDYLQINASGKSEEFLSMMETIANAVSNPQITPDNFAKVRNDRIKLVGELNRNPGYVADRAAAKRLFGEFPYGRPQEGTIESLKLIDRPDLIFAKERFLTGDNATLAISGNIKPDLAYRAVRRLFGAWKKSESLVPASFRVPEEPQTDLQIVTNGNLPNEIRFATKGVARNDANFFTAQAVIQILERRLKSREGNRAIAKINSNLLRGSFVFGVSDWKTSMVRMVGDKIPLPQGIEQTIQNLLAEPISETEFNEARIAIRESFSHSDPYSKWLDVDTYRLDSVKAQQQLLEELSLASARKFADALKTQAFASVLLAGSAETNLN
jgi:predicted Zn-dependent peptidase